MDGEVKVVILSVGVRDDLRQRFVALIAVEINTARGQLRLHGVGDKVHVVFLVAAVNVVVELLCGGA